MIYEYLVQNYSEGEPIFLSELPDISKNYVRREMKKLTDTGKVQRLKNGVYFLPYTTILGTKGRISIDKYVNKKYLFFNGQVSGYITGIQLANMYGFTSQNSAYIEVCSNNTSSKRQKVIIDGRSILVSQPVTKITKDNKTALQFLDLMTTIDKYSELSGSLLQEKLNKFVLLLNVDFNEVKKYISLFPDKVYKNIYHGGLMNELVSR